ncbi:MAG: hypothetical protein AAFZ01_05420, partial [Pseudomonadota bacterium]
KLCRAGYRATPSETSEIKAVDATDDAPAFIDIWRPARHDNHRNRNRARQSQANRRRGASQSGATAGTGDESTGASKPSRNASKRKASGGRNGGRASQGGGDRDARGPRHNNRRGDKRRNDVKAPATFSASPPQKKKREQAADPDSPFAALSKLKAQLETGAETATGDGANDQAT